MKIEPVMTRMQWRSLYDHTLLTLIRIFNFFINREEKSSSHDCNREKVIFLVSNGVHLGLNLCLFQEHFESDMGDVQVDGSLFVTEHFTENSPQKPVSHFLEVCSSCNHFDSVVLLKLCAV